FARAISMRLQDDARLAAVSGTRRGGNVTQFNRGVYSPCKECAGADQPPLWQLKARTIVHDQEKRQIVYRHARMEILGIPVAYTPYLSHPDPTVERRSGFLAPKFGSSTNIGSNLTVPYFWAIKPDRDILFEPLFTTKESVVGKATYQQAFDNGFLRIGGSATQEPSTDRFRGHLDTEVRFDLDPTWRTGADIKFASDDTYLGRYGISSEDTLTSHLFVEGFRDRSYANAEAYYFQGLAADDIQDTIPIVAPKLDYNFIGEPMDSGARLTMDANIQALTREDGPDSRRVSLVSGVHLPYTSPLGDVYDFRANVQTDLYDVDQVALGSSNSLASGITGRVMPRLSVEWRYPWVRRTGQIRQVLEPLVTVAVSPNGGNPGRIPNEDSSVFELDETNIFKPSRFPGKDRVEGGQHVAYGFRAGVFGEKGRGATIVVGQSYQVRTDDTFTIGSGLEDHFSDIVGRLTVSPSDFFKLTYKTRLDKDSFTARRNEVSASLGSERLRATANYLFFEEAGEFPEREELTLRLDSEINDQWSASVDGTRDLSANGGMLSYGGSLTYNCDCLILSLNARRTFTTDRDIKPTDSILLQVTFKTLGQVQGQIF
ncbi:MAG: LPS-assembly protein LptD, partial [Alphaproteobacteria bacterium]